MRALKVLIVIMGVLLVLGFTILAVMVFRKFQGMDSIHSEVPSEISWASNYSVVDIHDIAEKAVIHLRTSDGDDQILVLNPSTGQEIVKLGPARSSDR